MSDWGAHKAPMDSSKPVVTLVTKFSGSQNNNNHQCQWWWRTTEKLHHKHIKSFWKMRQHSGKPVTVSDESTYGTKAWSRNRILRQYFQQQQRHDHIKSFTYIFTEALFIIDPNGWQHTRPSMWECSTVNGASVPWHTSHQWKRINCWCT